MAKHRAPAPRAQRGETLAEVLVALLIVALATLLLAAMMSAASGVNIAARRQDKEFYAALEELETMSGTHTLGTVTIDPDPATAGTSPRTVNVQVYTSGDLTLYTTN